MRATVRVLLGFLLVVAGEIGIFYTVLPARTSNGYLAMFGAGCLVLFIGIVVVLSSSFKLRRPRDEF